MCGGFIKDFHDYYYLRSKINLYNFHDETWSLHAGGSPPLELHGCASATLSNTCYAYGGINGPDYKGSLYQWNSSTWMQLKKHHLDGPMKKSYCAMITRNEEEILLFGGFGIPSGPIQGGSSFVVNHRRSNHVGWTNELHSFNLKEGEREYQWM